MRSAWLESANWQSWIGRLESVMVPLLTNCNLWCCCFLTNLQTKYQILLYLACFSMLTTWIPSALHYLDIYLDLQLCCFTGLMCCIWIVPSLPVFFPFPSPPCWLFCGCFLDVNAAYHAGSSLQWDHKHCRKVCSLLQYYFSASWLSPQGHL